VKGLRKAGVRSLETANRYLEQQCLRLWNERFTVQPSGDVDAHRPLQESPPHGFRPLQEGLCRLLAEPTPSPRLCISAQARPLADAIRLS
jgi:hypothetical protein